MLSIRAATISDVPLLRSLIRELAEYERESQEVLITEEQLRRDGFGPSAIFRAIVAEQDGQPAGFAVFFTSFSTWTGSGLFLEDLFVRETFRGHGVGKALVCRVAEIARKEGSDPRTIATMVHSRLPSRCTSAITPADIVPCEPAIWECAEEEYPPPLIRTSQAPRSRPPPPPVLEPGSLANWAM